MGKKEIPFTLDAWFPAHDTSTLPVGHPGQRRPLAPPGVGGKPPVAFEQQQKVSASQEVWEGCCKHIYGDGEG